MGFGDLAVLVLQQIGLVAVEDAGRAARDARGMGAAFDAMARGFDTDDLDAFVIEKRVERRSALTVLLPAPWRR